MSGRILEHSLDSLHKTYVAYVKTLLPG